MSKIDVCVIGFSMLALMFCVRFLDGKIAQIERRLDAIEAKLQATKGTTP